MNGCLQKLEPESLKVRTLRAEHYHPMAGHQDERRIYDTMQKKFFWSHMAIDVYETVINCATCASINEPTKLKRHLQFFPASGPLKYVAVDILGSLSRTKNGNEYIIVMTDRYLKIKCAIPTSKTAAAHVGNVFVDQ